MISHRFASVRPLVMVIEDDEDLREQLCEILEFEGYEPLSRKDPEAGLGALARGAVPGVIVLDLALPGIGGTGFLRRLRGSGGLWSTIPVLLLSGWGDLDGLGLSVQLTMKKPPDPVTFARAIDRLARRSPQSQPEWPAAHAAGPT